jgi:hypothetical protein
LPLDELAETLEMSAGELLNAIESEEAVCREITNDDDQLMVELEVFGKSCRFKMVSQE